MRSEQKKTKLRKPKETARAVKSQPQLAVVKTRKLKKPSYRSFKLHIRIRHPAKLPSSFELFRRAIGILGRNWKVVGGMLLIYGVLQIVLAQALSSGLDLQGLKADLEDTLQDNSSQFGNGLALFGVLLGSAGGSGDPASTVYQSILVVVVSLALVWTFRQLQAGKKVGIRDGFYRGMYPLIPFILVLLVIGLQLLPLLIGNTLYGIIVANGIAVSGLEQGLWALLFFLLALLSLYMVSSSVFALYIVTLPDMTPMRALRSARQLVLHRRWTVLRKALFLPFALLLLAAALLLPVIIFLTPLAQLVFFMGTLVSMAIAHSYMYSLYRELL